MPITRAVRIAFRVAAGPRLGFGHLARCRAIAAALGVTPAVSIRGTGETRAAARRMGIDVLPSSRRQVLRGLDLLVVDDPSLDAGRPWVVAARRAGVTVVAVHDAAPTRHPADLVIDGSPRTRGRERGRLRGGPRFAVLDPRVPSLRRQRRQGAAPSLLVALGGGARALGRTHALVRCLAQQLPGGHIAVASGFTVDRRPALHGGRWLAPAALAPALANAHVALVGGGLTALEAAALGVPAVAVAVVPAQRLNIRALAARGVVVDGGSIGGPAAASRLARKVRALWTSPRRRRRLAAAGRRLVDGRGAERIASEIRRLARQVGSR